MFQRQDWGEENKLCCAFMISNTKLYQYLYKSSNFTIVNILLSYPSTIVCMNLFSKE